MPVLKALDDPTTNQALRAAVTDRAPLIAAVRRDGGWVNLPSRFLGLRGGSILLAEPIPEDPAPASRLGVGQSICLTFQHDDRKYICPATVLERTREAAGDDGPAAVVLVCRPTAIRRVQRRASVRYDLPDEVLALAQFSLGWKGDPDEPDTDGPVWPARVVDLSTQGAKLRAERNHALALDSGDGVALRFSFGLIREAVCLNAVCRYVQPFEPDARKVLIGFHFVGPEGTLRGRQISDMVRFWAALCGR
jgi:c-di-GMP-binding flagellar brake protein YcgR